MPSSQRLSPEPILTGTALHRLLELIANRIIESAAAGDQPEKSLSATNPVPQALAPDRDTDGTVIWEDIDS